MKITRFLSILKEKEILFVSEIMSKIQQRLGIPVNKLFQQDHQPLYGAYPTSDWLPDELIREQYDVVVPEDLSPGTYEIWIGLWNPLTKQRLQSNGKKTIKIGEIHITHDARMD